jgi:hypothetical protein
MRPRHGVSGYPRPVPGGTRPGPVCVLGIAVAMALSLSGCQKMGGAEAASYEPATVEEVENLDVKAVTLAEEGAALIGLATAIAQPAAPHTTVPYAALIYDGQGVPWVYTRVRPLTFLRAHVVVDRIEGDLVMLSGGLAPGTEVVTVGAAEVYGAELGIAGGH